MFVIIRKTGELEEFVPKKFGDHVEYAEMDELLLWVRRNMFKTRKLKPLILGKKSITETHTMYYFGYPNGKVASVFNIYGAKYFDDACVLRIDEENNHILSLDLATFREHHVYLADNVYGGAIESKTPEKEEPEPPPKEEELVETDYED
jgi:hypothetical protein